MPGELENWCVCKVMDGSTNSYFIYSGHTCTKRPALVLVQKRGSNTFSSYVQTMHTRAFSRYSGYWGSINRLEHFIFEAAVILLLRGSNSLSIEIRNHRSQGELEILLHAFITSKLATVMFFFMVYHSRFLIGCNVYKTAQLEYYTRQLPKKYLIQDFKLLRYVNLYKAIDIICPIVRGLKKSRDCRVNCTKNWLMILCSSK